MESYGAVTLALSNVFLPELQIGQVLFDTVSKQIPGVSTKTLFKTVKHMTLQRNKTEENLIFE
jgi:hypothetical protein